MSIPRAAAPLLALALVACTPPPSSSSAATDAASSAGACMREGDRCEFAPGKIGLCTAKPGCTGDGCFACMSLH
jgi:hypothetical protein